MYSIYRNLFFFCLFVFFYHFSRVACFWQFVIFSGLNLAKPVAMPCLWLMRWLCGGLHQVTTFCIARDRGYFCFLLVTVYITQSFDRAVLTSSSTHRMTSYLGVFCKAIFLACFSSLKCHNMAHPGKYFSNCVLLLEDLHWNTLVSILERQQQMKKCGVYVLLIR